MKADGFCRQCGHHHSVHTHACIEWDRHEITEELIDSVNYQKKLNKEEELARRNIKKQELVYKVASLEAQVKQQKTALRSVVDRLSSLVMAPLNPHYLDYLETLQEKAKQRGAIALANAIDQEYKSYAEFIKLIKP